MAETVFSKARCKLGEKKPASLKAKLVGHTSLAVLIKRPQAEANRRFTSISSWGLAGKPPNAMEIAANYVYPTRADGLFYWGLWCLGCIEAGSSVSNPPPAQHGDSAMRMRFWDPRDDVDCWGSLLFADTQYRVCRHRTNKSVRTSLKSSDSDMSRAKLMISTLQSPKSSVACSRTNNWGSQC